MRTHNKQAPVVSPQREALRAVLHECDAFINWADWSRPVERSSHSIISMLRIIRGVAMRGLRKRCK
jgi:hypothetical protein